MRRSGTSGRSLADCNRQYFVLRTSYLDPVGRPPKAPQHHAPPTTCVEGGRWLSVIHARIGVASGWVSVRSTKYPLLQLQLVRDLCRRLLLVPRVLRIRQPHDREHHEEDGDGTENEAGEAG